MWTLRHTATDDILANIGRLSRQAVSLNLIAPSHEEEEEEEDGYASDDAAASKTVQDSRVCRRSMI